MAKETLCNNFIYYFSNLQPSIISSLIILEGFSEMINSIKIFHECVCVSEYSLSVSLPHCPFPLPTPTSTYTENFIFARLWK